MKIIVAVLLVGLAAQTPELQQSTQEKREAENEARVRAARELRRRVAEPGEQKLDRILDKLEKIEKRLTAIEKALGIKPAPLRISGRVILDGKPFDGASVKFFPVDKTGKELSATTQQDGSFQLDEALPGKYKVTVTKNAAKLPAKYSDPDKSSLVVEVTTEGGIGIFDFNLQSR